MSETLTNSEMKGAQCAALQAKHESINTMRNRVNHSMGPNHFVFLTPIVPYYHLQIN